MRRIRLRSVLPLSQLILFTWLIWIACPYRPIWQGWLGIHTHISGDFFSDGTSFPEQLADGINLPVAFVTDLLSPLQNGLMLDVGLQSLVRHLVTAALVPILWFFVGRAIDHRRNLNQLESSLCGWQSAFIICGVAGCAILSALNLIAFRYRVLDFITVRLLALAWSSIGIIFLVRKFRRPQSSTAL
jgi:hypothetical protein